MGLRAYLISLCYDAAMRHVETACLRAWRTALLAHSAGEVLEIGAGTGANLPHYGCGVRSLTLCEPSRPMRRRLEARTVRLALTNCRILPHGVESLDFPDASFDIIVSTLVLCSVRDPAACAAKLRRLLRPGGRLLVIEHVADTDHSRIHRWQRRLGPLWQIAAGGCHLDRQTEACLAVAGFVPDGIVYDNLRDAPAVVRRCLRGSFLRGEG